MSLTELTRTGGSTGVDPQELISFAGASLVGLKRTTISDQVSGTLQHFVDAMTVSIWEFEHKVTNKPDPSNPSTWDWTPALQAAAASLDNGGLNPQVSGGCILIPPAYKDIVYRITEVEIPVSVCIWGVGATVAPFNLADTRTYLIKLLGMNKVIGLNLSMDFSVTYECGIWIRGRNIDITSCSVWFAKRAINVGDPLWVTDIANSWQGDSEIAITNCQFNWCLKTAAVYGLNSIVNFGGGSRVYSNPGSISPTHPNATSWLAAPRCNLEVYGAIVYVTGAFIGTFTRDVPSLISYPVNTNVANYQPTYGRFVLANTHIESSFLLYAPAPSGFVVTDETTAMLVMDGCQGYVATSATDLYWISCSSSMKQKILISSSNSFYGSAGVAPTRAKLISAPGGEVEIHPNKYNWPCISGEVKSACNINYPINRKGINLVTAFGSSQAINTVSSTLAMPNLGETDLVASARGLYYNSAGNYTAAVELNNVKIDVDLRYVTPASANTVVLDLVVSGVTVDTVVAPGAYSRVTLKARRIAKGATFLLRATGSASYVLDGGASTKMSLIADV